MDNPIFKGTSPLGFTMVAKCDNCQEPTKVGLLYFGLCPDCCEGFCIDDPMAYTSK